MKTKTEIFLPLSPALMGYCIDVGRAGDDRYLKQIEEIGSNHPEADMMSSKEEVKLLQLLCKMLKARFVIEIGVFVGYTALALAQSVVDDGKVFALDVSRDYLDFGGLQVWSKCSSGKKIDFRIGAALESLHKLEHDDDMSGKIDLIYVDADKTNYVNYVVCCMKLVRVGGLIVVDNTLWKGRILDDSRQDENTRGIRNVNLFIRNLDPSTWEIVCLPFADGVTMILRLK